MVWKDQASQSQTGFFLLPTKVQTSSHSMESPQVASSTLSSKAGRLSTFFERLVDGLATALKRPADAADAGSLLKVPQDGGFFLGRDGAGLGGQGEGLVTGVTLGSLGS